MGDGGSGGYHEFLVRIAIGIKLDLARKRRVPYRSFVMIM